MSIETALGVLFENVIVELPGEEGDALGGRESDGRGRVVEVWVRMSSDARCQVKRSKRVPGDMIGRLRRTGRWTRRRDLGV